MKWVLPEYIEDVLPEEAVRIEQLRRDILDLFAAYGYELVIPPLIEYLDSLLTGTGSDLDMRTFKLVDQLSGRMMGVRADITPQVARLDAHLLNRKGVVRLCYAGSVLHTRPAGPAATREPIQIGAEVYGHAGVESDLEVQQLLCRALEVARVRGARLDVGHVAVFRSLAAAAEASPELETELFGALQRKDAPALRGLTAKLPARLRDALLLLPELYGGREVLALAARRLPRIPALKHALATLQMLAKRCPIPLTFDLAELRGYRYQSGVVFDAYCQTRDGGSLPIARGGRYDEVGRAFGRPRPATGFSIELRELAAVAAPRKPPAPILAPYRAADATLAKAIARLRAAGETVIEDLPGHAGQRTEYGARRRLLKRNGRWRVASLEK
jgi:ATP phosphoribosyltransferase regulatory subunit